MSPGVWVPLGRRRAGGREGSDWAFVVLTHTPTRASSSSPSLGFALGYGHVIHPQVKRTKVSPALHTWVLSTRRGLGFVCLGVRAADPGVEAERLQAVWIPGTSCNRGPSEGGRASGTTELSPSQPVSNGSALSSGEHLPRTESETEQNGGYQSPPTSPVSFPLSLHRAKTLAESSRDRTRARGQGFSVSPASLLLCVLQHTRPLHRTRNKTLSEAQAMGGKVCPPSTCRSSATHHLRCGWIWRRGLCGCDECK